ncbi:MBL fold metallo-hydrolase [Alkaliphilus pronyensis]|uniref:MBL fold metallo-hydrolase n=1 Tax=Alkaliphilus pronyensis TaxID=1482732 RepID=A0A6I0FIL1_9FIRM|nr:ComEC/Rec2 family competence protein [Alkaliphilus pronyensis]KAB3539076.1 MBL fold metallo-hydrolase [Alkaliphilus pronyensis]
MKIKYNILILTLAFLIMLLATGCNEAIDTRNLNIHIIDVGQGDCILITAPEGKTILIDGGEAKYSKDIINYIKKHEINSIDILIATHPHADHIGGLADVIEDFKVNEIIMPPVAHTSKAFEELLITIKDKDLKITAAEAGLQYEIQDDITLSILGPLFDYGDNLNNWSATAKLTYKDKSFLFTGDIEVTAEMDIINSYNHSYLKSDFLKVSHHGSNTSTHQDFLEVISPNVAVISVGRENPYGFPHKEVIERLQSNNILIYRTDLHSTLVFSSDGHEIWTNKKPSN